jgi:hypothetical protein
MDNQIDDGFTMHGREKSDGDLMRQSRCNIIDQNPTHHAQTKHIDVQHHFVQERVENGEVQFEYCPIKHMVVDVLTKALSKERHHKLINMFELDLIKWEC